MNTDNKKINIFTVTDCHQEVRKLCNLFSYIADNSPKNGKNTLICDCGDLFKGIYDRDLCVDGYLKLRSLLPEAKIVLAIGNNDFGFNLENFKFLQKTISVFNNANINVLCANLIDVNTEKCPDWVDPYIILDINHKKILVTAFCVNLVRLQKYGVRLIDIPNAFQQMEKVIKHINPDAFIVLNHALKDSSYNLADMAAKDGIKIDLLIGGHEHSPIEANETKHIYYPQAFSKTMLEFELCFGENGALLNFIGEIYSKGLPINSIFVPQIEEYEKKAGLNIPVAKSTVNLEKIYSDPCSLGTFIADGMRSEAHADMAVISTGYTSHALRYEKDKILTNYNLERAISATVALQKMLLRPADIKDIFNNALRNRYIQRSGNVRFLQCSKNVTVVCYKNKDNWGMVRQIYISGNPLFDENGEPLNPGETFSCAIDPFVAAGEQGFDVLRKIPKETLMKNNQIVRIKDVFVKAIKDAPKKYTEGFQYPEFKLIDESA
ncbi:MAG: 5'-nucleotidase C-terminal domain-containing protein [Alphaproteobacteria bacterium]|nr:5'-nucleotidase C-terminal domain-containing protein [Alphaproteobacteria bacterium]